MITVSIIILTVENFVECVENQLKPLILIVLLYKPLIIVCRNLAIYVQFTHSNFYLCKFIWKITLYYHLKMYYNYNTGCLNTRLILKERNVIMNRVKVTISGKEYPLQTNESPEYIMG